MRNRFPGVCYRCGKVCEAGAGHFEMQRYQGEKRWLVQHANCAIRHRGTRHVDPSMPTWVHALRNNPGFGRPKAEGAP